MVSMKRFLIILSAIIVSQSLMSQNIEEQDIKRYSVEGSSKQVKKAKEYAEEYRLDEKGELNISIVKEYPQMSKSDLWKKIQNWVLSSSSNSQSSVQMMDENGGIIIERCYIPAIAKRTMGDNKYLVSIRPQLKFEFKEEKIRFTFALQNYEVVKTNDDSGYAIMLGGGIGVTGSGVTQKSMIWKLTECCPYVNEEEDEIVRPKVTSARAYINSIACYKVLLEQIDTVVNNSDVPTTNNEDW